MGDELKDCLVLLKSEVSRLSHEIRKVGDASVAGLHALESSLSETDRQLGRLSRLAAYVDLEKGAELDAALAENIKAAFPEAPCHLGERSQAERDLEEIMRAGPQFFGVTTDGVSLVDFHRKGAEPIRIESLKASEIAGSIRFMHDHPQSPQLRTARHRIYAWALQTLAERVLKENDYRRMMCESAKSVGEEIHGRLENFSEELKSGLEIETRYHYAIEGDKPVLAAVMDAQEILDNEIECVELDIPEEIRTGLGEAMKANPATKIREKIAANYVRFMETIVGPDLPEGVSPSAAVPNASHALTHREVVAWNAHQEKVTEGTLFFIQSEENRTPVYVVLPDGKETLEYFDYAALRSRPCYPFPKRSGSLPLPHQSFRQKNGSTSSTRTMPA